MQVKFHPLPESGAASVSLASQCVQKNGAVIFIHVRTGCPCLHLLDLQVVAIKVQEAPVTQLGNRAVTEAAHRGLRKIILHVCQEKRVHKVGAGTPCSLGNGQWYPLNLHPSEYYLVIVAQAASSD